MKKDCNYCYCNQEVVLTIKTSEIIADKDFSKEFHFCSYEHFIKYVKDRENYFMQRSIEKREGL